MFDFIVNGYRVLFLLLAGFIGFGWAIVALSFLCSLLMAPLMKAVSGIVRRESEYQDVILPQIAAIKKQYSFDIDRNYHIRRLYQRYSYSPISAVRKVLPLFVQIPFLLLTYCMLKGTPQLGGVSFMFLRDLGTADGLIHGVNLLPFVMTGVNAVTVFATPDFTRRDMVQAIAIALLFLAMLYNAPSALLLYWTLNNTITCVRTLVGKGGKGAATLGKRMLVVRLLPAQAVRWCSRANLRLLGLSLFLLACYFANTLYFGDDIKDSYTYTISKFGFLIAATASMVLAPFSCSWSRLSHLPKYLIDTVGLGGRTLITHGFWLMIPVAFAIHYSFSSKDLSLSASSVTMLVLHLTWPCLAFSALLVLLFRNTVSPGRLFQIAVAFFAGIYIIPMISTESGIRCYQTNIWLRLAVVASSILASLVIRKRSSGAVFAGLLLLASVFNGWSHANAERTANTKIGHDRVVSALGPDVHCVKSNNVYFLIYDSYAHRHVLKALGINKDHSIDDVLNENGFTLYDAYSTGTYTLSSMQRAFTFNGLSGSSPRATIAGDNVFCDFLKDAGYRTSYLLSSYIMPDENERAPGDYYFPERKDILGKDQILKACIFKGMMTPVSSVFNKYSHEDWLRAYDTIMSRRANVREFIYAHSSFPMHAKVDPKYRLSDSEEQEKYGQRLAKADQEIKQTLELIRDDKDAIVIIASDHGGALLSPDPPGNYDMRHLLDRHGILLAIRWPEDYKPCLKLNSLQNVCLEVMIYLSGDTNLAKFYNPSPTEKMNAPIGSPANLIRHGVVQSGKHHGRTLFEAAAMDFCLTPDEPTDEDSKNAEKTGSANPRDIPIPPKQKPYNWVIAESHLEPGKSYAFHADSVLIETGETPSVEAILYEHGSRRFCKRHKFTVGEDKMTSPLEWSFDVPQGKGEYSLLVYAGAAGKCEGIGVLYKSISVEKQRCASTDDLPPRSLSTGAVNKDDISGSNHMPAIQPANARIE